MTFVQLTFCSAENDQFSLFSFICSTDMEPHMRDNQFVERIISPLALVGSQRTTAPSPAVVIHNHGRKREEGNFPSSWLQGASWLNTVHNRYSRLISPLYQYIGLPKKKWTQSFTTQLLQKKFHHIGALGRHPVSTSSADDERNNERKGARLRPQRESSSAVTVKARWLKSPSFVCSIVIVRASEVVILI